MIQRRIFRSMVAGAAGLLVLPFVSVPAGAAVAPLVTVPDTAPSWAKPANATGTPSSTDVVSIRVALQLRSAAAAESLALAVSKPGSASYGKYLTPAQFNARFAPTDQSVAEVKKFLTTSGLTVTDTAAGNRWVGATGTVAQLDKAFDTTLKTYTFKGSRLRAPAADVKVPSSIAAEVSTVTGLTQDSTLHQPDHRSVVPDPRTPAARTVTPSVAKPTPSQCSNYWGQYQQTVPLAFGHTSYNTFICGYQPAQLRQAYGTQDVVTHGTDGRGVTVAIIDAYASPTMLSDANAYAKAVGEPAFKAGQYSESTFGPFNLQTECLGEAGWNLEESLDVEAVHGMAPGATIHYFGAQNCDAGIDVALNYVVQHHSADIVSNSYGNLGEDVGTDEINLEHSIFVQAGIEGMGMYFSSGDDGDDVIDGLAPTPDYPASDPLVTAVGGTSLLLDKNSQRITEAGWETTLDRIDYTGSTPVYTGSLPGQFVFGGGGGTSSVFAQPAYQASIVPDSLAFLHQPSRKRVVPDISAVGDPYTGFYFGETVDGTFGIGTIGGTSLAAPVIAGIQAVASQHRPFPIGFANPLLYSVSWASYHDVQPKTLHYASPAGNYVGTFDSGTTLITGRGYDNTTGRGTPNGPAFLLNEVVHP